MPKRRRGAVDDSEESEEVSENELKDDLDVKLESGSDSEGTDTARSRNRKRRLEAIAASKKEEADAEGNDGEMHWPVVLKTNKRSKKQNRANNGDDDDDEYTESGSDDEEEASDGAGSDEEFEYSDGGFVVDSDDNVVPSNRVKSRTRRRSARGQSSRSRRGRGRPKRARKQSDESEVEDIDSDDAFSASDGSIAEDLKELRGQNSPTRRNRNYRTRAPVNYAIPPPPTIEEVANATAQAADAAKHSKAIDPKLRRLFDVRGPFGGNDVHSIFNLDRKDLESVIKVATSKGNAGGASAINGAFENSRGTANSSASGAVGSSADIDPVDVQGDIDFSMVGGLDDYISKLKEMVSLPLLYPELYEKFGITPPRGVLFHGPPGTGKTLMARALAASHQQEKVTFYMRKGADILSKWIGESERQLRALFDEARAHQPSIIFFDEIDGLAPVRSARQEQHHASIVSTLLALMDGMDNRGQVVIIGATNRPDSVDPALRRPGRFDREFYFPLPDMEARARILEIHTRKWQPPLPKPLLSSIAERTKGFGGADLRALTTEAALLAIHRAYPQIYGSEAKLSVDSSRISVRPQDFALALERIQPSTSRAAGVSLAHPLPPRVAPLLEDTFNKVTHRIRAIFPTNSKESETAALFLSDAQFSQVQEIKNFSQSRIHRPKLLLEGASGNGQGYLLRAVANILEGVYIREISISAIFGSGAGAVQPESAIVNAVAEARQRAPSCVLLPSLSEWANATHLAALLAGLLRGLLPSERVFVIGSDEQDTGHDPLVLSPLRSYFDVERIDIQLNTSGAVLLKFFEPVLDFVKRTPLQCREAQEMPQAKPPKLKTVDKTADKNDVVDKPLTDPVTKSANKVNARVLTEDKRSELKVRSQLKLKLGLILDGFRQKYRRFRKPIIDEQRLVHLFETPKLVKPLEPAKQNGSVSTPSAAETEAAEPKVEENGDLDAVPDQAAPIEPEEEDEDDVDEPYVLTEDNMILERTTNKKYYNMDLETVEDRLWNGFYCEPDQFLEDMEMIYKDSVVHGERERMHKASEMLANAQVAIDDISSDKQFIAACQELHVKDARTRLREINEDKPEAPGTMDGAANGPESSVATEKQNDTSENEANKTVQQPFVAASDSDGQIPEQRQAYFDDSSANVNSMEGVVETSSEQVDTDESEALGGNVTYDVKSFDEFSGRLVKIASGLNLETLEQLFALLSDVSWRYRKDWDRTAMIESMKAHLETVEPKEIGNA